MPINSRKKGANFELVVAKLFAAWTGDVVRRTPLSGGWSKEKEFGVVGDLVFTKVDGLHVECKKRQGWALEDLLLGVNKDMIAAWWKQTTTECPKHEDGSFSRLPLLVFSRNGRAPLVMFPENRGQVLGKDAFIQVSGLGKRRSFEFQHWQVLVMKLSLFMKVFKYIGPMKPAQGLVA